jgi:hypothetical protein
MGHRHDACFLALTGRDLNQDRVRRVFCATPPHQLAAGSRHPAGHEKVGLALALSLRRRSATRAVRDPSRGGGSRIVLPLNTAGAIESRPCASKSGHQKGIVAADDFAPPRHLPWLAAMPWHDADGCHLAGYGLRPFLRIAFSISSGAYSRAAWSVSTRRRRFAPPIRGDSTAATG